MTLGCQEANICVYMVFNLQLLGLVIGLFWLLILTVLYWRMSTHYNKLAKGTNGKTLKSILETVLNDLKISQKDIDFLKGRCDKIESDNLLHIQKVGLLRFNPFKDTGGDQSFILVLTDANNTGVVISNLYSRSGTRWYAKKISSGKGVEHELSEEEIKAIKEARKI